MMHDIFVYGSLLNRSSASSLLNLEPEAIIYREAVLIDWILAFDVGEDVKVNTEEMEVAFLNVEEKKGGTVYGQLLTISNEQLDMLKIRERSYQMISIQVLDVNLKKEVTALMAFGRKRNEDLPILDEYVKKVKVGMQTHEENFAKNSMQSLIKSIIEKKVIKGDYCFSLSIQNQLTNVVKKQVDRLLLDKVLLLKECKPSLFSPIKTFVKEVDLEIMRKASLELMALVKKDEYISKLLHEKPDVAQYNLGNLSSMIAMDFHITPSGPKLIEINTNAGGLITAALWSYENNSEKLNVIFQHLVLMFQKEYSAWQEMQHSSRELRHIAIIDENPEGEFTYDDFMFMAEVFKSMGCKVHIAKSSDVFISHDKAYIKGYSEPVDLIYNRDCDFYLNETRNLSLRQIYIEGLACVSPNPYGYALLSDKVNLALIYEEVISTGCYPSLKEVLLPTMKMVDFLEKKISRKKWFFKPTNDYAGNGVFRGKKISGIKFNSLNVKHYIAQQEAAPGLLTYEGDDFKYDVRIFMYDGVLIDVISRVYQGRITNFRTIFGGYSPVVVI